eukprot:3072963-Pyramimonas_sp.AAC.1
MPVQHVSGGFHPNLSAAVSGTLLDARCDLRLTFRVGLSNVVAVPYVSAAFVSGGPPSSFCGW